MRSWLIGVVAVLPLCGCAVAARPGAAESLGMATRPADPESLEGWQSVVDQHGAALARLALDGPGAVHRERPPADAPAEPGSPRPDAAGPRPAAPAHPAPPPPAACESTRVTAKKHGGRWSRDELDAYRRPLTRCERACLHVNAICYASQRICRIAERLGDPAARASCAGAQQRCVDARAVARRAGCGCG